MNSTFERQARRTLARGLLCCGIVAILCATQARAGAVSYDFYLAGIRLGSLEIGSERTNRRYSAVGRFETAGLLGFLDFFFDGQATGTITPDGTVVPSHFVAASKSPRAFRQTRIDWQDGMPIRVSVDPPRSTSPEPAEQTATLDPVSAGFRLLSDAPADRILQHLGGRLRRVSSHTPNARARRRGRISPLLCGQICAARRRGGELGRPA